jgi:hypothetical protein
VKRILISVIISTRIHSNYDDVSYGTVWQFYGWVPLYGRPEACVLIPVDGCSVTLRNVVTGLPDHTLS